MAAIEEALKRALRDTKRRGGLRDGDAGLFETGDGVEEIWIRGEGCKQGARRLRARGDLFAQVRRKLGAGPKAKAGDAEAFWEPDIARRQIDFCLVHVGAGAAAVEEEQVAASVGHDQMRAIGFNGMRPSDEGERRVHQKRRPRGV